MHMKNQRIWVVVLLLILLQCSIAAGQIFAADTDLPDGELVSKDISRESEDSSSDDGSDADAGDDTLDHNEPDPDTNPEDNGKTSDLEKPHKQKASDGNVVLLARSSKLPAGKLVHKGGRYCYLRRDGSRLTDTWAKIGRNIYYFGTDGFARTGQYRYKANEYYFDKKGHLYHGRWRKVKKDRYYYALNGAMVRGEWRWIHNSMYYFQSSGKMARSCWKDGCYLKASGKLDFSKGSGTTKRYKGSGNKNRLIIVGASRVWQMKKAVLTDSNIIYICKNGAGLSWFKKTACARLKKTLKKYPKSKVVIQLGNNDLQRNNAEDLFAKYAAVYQEILLKYPKTTFFFMDILPRKPLNSRKNINAKKFNTLLKRRFPRQYIGGYSHMVQEGFSTSYNDDHYCVKTSRDIFNYILNKTK